MTIFHELDVTRQGKMLLQQITDTVLPPAAVAIWALGQNGFLLKWQSITIMFDPYLTNSIYEAAGEPWSRAYPSPLAPSQCATIDYVVCSHHHDDHMDKQTIQQMAAYPHTKFVVPKAHEKLIESYGVDVSRVITISHGEQIKLTDGVMLKAHKAMHDQFETDEQGEHKYLSYVVSFGDKLQLFHAGDTVGFSTLAEWAKADGDIDVAMLPINGRDFSRTERGIVGNMNYREAIDLGRRMKAKLLVPMHVGIFPHNDENPAFFVDYLFHQYPMQSFHLFAPGERFIYWQ
ncbi:MBL fold metallo-hydrolase [Paenibacillus yanchengensis]|uniref:MBL fold metallo-hydrolase n=1 Tax=Paenibacillus yanchengensis TaxID=2035833 RepID=A0ABW4YJ92_9BACL